MKFRALEIKHPSSVQQVIVTHPQAPEVVVPILPSQDIEVDHQQPTLSGKCFSTSPHFLHNLRPVLDLSF